MMQWMLQHVSQLRNNHCYTADIIAVGYIVFLPKDNTTTYCSALLDHFFHVTYAFYNNLLINLWWCSECCNMFHSFATTTVILLILSLSDISFFYRKIQNKTQTHVQVTKRIFAWRHRCALYTQRVDLVGEVYGALGGFKNPSRWCCTFIERVGCSYVFPRVTRTTSVLKLKYLSLIHIWRCRRSTLCRSRWSPYH